MDEPEKTIPPKEVCSMRIVFPVDTDEDAIRYKKAITNILADIPSAFISFSLSTAPPFKDPRHSTSLTPNSGLI